MIYIFTAITIVLLASFSGIIFAWKPIHLVMQRYMHYFVTFSIGVFIVIAYKFFNEAISQNETVTAIIVSALGGVLFLEIVGHLIPDSHHHHKVEHGHRHNKIDARRLLISHSLRIPIDGLIITSSFLTDVRIGILATFGILLHEIIQNISQFFVLKESGYSNKKALLLSLLSSSTILLGVLLSVFATIISESIPLLLSFAGGAFIYVIARDLLPGTLRSMYGRKAISIHLVAGVLGVLVMFGVGTITQEPNIKTITDSIPPYETRLF